MFYSKFYSELEFLFLPNENNFIVEEVPLYDFHGNGEHIILKISKKNITTFDLIKRFANILNIKERDIGYAGLKDKHALTYQFISIPRKCDPKKLESLDNVKILDSYFHENKLRIGHLKGNNFFIRLKKVNFLNFKRIKEEFLSSFETGIPNFFGTQRFGIHGNNFLNIDKDKMYKNKKDKFLISSLQSFHFNNWLEERLKISNLIDRFSIKESKMALNNLYKIELDSDDLKILKESKLILKPLCGDVCKHYPFGKFFVIKNIQDEIARIVNYDTCITGLLCGKTNFYSTDHAKIIEDSFIDSINAIGSRRYAMIKPLNPFIEYIKKEAQVILKFFLPSGGYATNFLEFIKNGRITKEKFI